MSNEVTKEETENFANFMELMHKTIIEESGGHSVEVRSRGLLEGAAYKILSYCAKESSPAKIGAYVYLQIAPEQIFFDGNKRTAHVIAKILMLQRGLHLEIHYKDAVNFIVEIADHKKELSEIEAWILKYGKTYNNEKDLQECIEDIKSDIINSDEYEDK